MIYQNSKGETIESDFVADMCYLPVLPLAELADLNFQLAKAYNKGLLPKRKHIND